MKIEIEIPESEATASAEALRRMADRGGALAACELMRQAADAIDAEVERAVAAEQRVYILHPRSCLAAFTDLRDCPWSTALDEHGVWDGHHDRVVTVDVDILWGDWDHKRRMTIADEEVS